MSIPLKCDHEVSSFFIFVAGDIEEGGYIACRIQGNKKFETYVAQVGQKLMLTIL